MSIIKRLKLKGFKSFVNPTVLDFENGFNTIIGANGSGKSNVFDAICFVLGRISSKGLRADKLGNLVFNGGKNMKPASEAEVAIFLSNDEKELMNIDLDEIKISRIVKKTGISQYFLNNNKVTRTEIVEILKRAKINPDGYNIILQGDIMNIVNMSTNERRELIEEISDISGYEEKRIKGIKKLEKVELDLKDADLLMEEKIKYLKALKSEKEIAERYYKVKDDLRFNSLLLVKSKLVKNKELKEKKKETLEKTEENLKSYKDKLSEYETEIKTIEGKILELEKSIEIKSHENFIEVTNKITSLESEIKNNLEKKAESKKQVDEIKTKNINLKENISKNKKEINELNLKKKDLEKDKKQLEKNLIEIEKNLAPLKSNISGEGFEELDKIDLEIDKLNENKHSKDLIKQDNAIQIERLNAKIEHFEMDLKKIESLGNENKEQIKILEKNRSELKKLIMKISSVANKNSEISSKLNKLQIEYNNLIEDSSKLRMKVETSKDLISTNRAVDTIIKFKSRDNSIHGTVSELASADDKYSLALETLTGRSLFNIVVENDSTAVKYINYLKENKVGNATFLPLNKIKTKFTLDDSVLNKRGVIDYALNLVKFDKRYENIFHLILQDSIIIEKIEDAKNIGIGKFKMITLGGDLVAKSGAMSGGFRSRKKGLGAFKDDKLFKKLDDLETKSYRLKETITHLQEEKSESERELYDLRYKKSEVESEVLKLEKLLSIEGKDTEYIKSELNKLLSDKSVVEASLNKISKDIKYIDEDILKLQNKKNKLKEGNFSQQGVFKEITKYETERDRIKDLLMTVTSKIDGFNIQLENVLKPEILNLERILELSFKSQENLNKQISNLIQVINNLEKELKEFKVKEKELSKDHKQFIEQRDKFREDKKKIEEKYNKIFEKFDIIKEKAAQLRYAIGEFDILNKTLNEELEILYEQLKIELIEHESKDDNDNENKKIEELINSVDEKLQTRTIDVKELQNKVNNLKNKMNSFGSINMKAVEIYDKLNDEFNKLLEKRETLNIEKTEILDFIEELDVKKKDKFMETYVELKRNFIEIYSKLSTKGEAELNVENEKDLFNSGIEIKVRLSKTNYLDIKSLSGGEKTITAIAFIFAVQKFNPASFYIFDEVDAALDIMNSEKLGSLIKENARNAQYIVVSHSEYLIQSAEYIYGVTMDKNKVSGVLSLDLSNMKDHVEMLN